jgi:hypothetical protein
MAGDGEGRGRTFVSAGVLVRVLAETDDFGAIQRVLCQLFPPPTVVTSTDSTQTDPLETKDAATEPENLSEVKDALAAAVDDDSTDDSDYEPLPTDENGDDEEEAEECGEEEEKHDEADDEAVEMEEESSEKEEKSNRSSKKRAAPRRRKNLHRRKQRRTLRGTPPERAADHTKPSVAAQQRHQRQREAADLAAELEDAIDGIPWYRND